MDHLIKNHRNIIHRRLSYSDLLELFHSSMVLAKAGYLVLGQGLSSHWGSRVLKFPLTRRFSLFNRRFLDDDHWLWEFRTLCPFQFLKLLARELFAETLTLLVSMSCLVSSRLAWNVYKWFVNTVGPWMIYCFCLVSVRLDWSAPESHH